MTLLNGTSTTRRKFIFSGLAGGIATAVTLKVASPAEASEETELGAALIKAKSVPLHGGKIVKGKYVVTQPSKNVFKCFSAICTHQGCTVATVSHGTINCPCHGSKYSIRDGHVVRGPAPRGLAKKKIVKKKGVIRLV
ncbi:Rieske (2Fe-2S) protein [Streptosporangiaceae bacterium NEAU-GS5]|nr:Rieske (2Fe-2S) protein [Streptosporangiaceae bacterium NEAU-GS5]